MWACVCCVPILVAVCCFCAIIITRQENQLGSKHGFLYLDDLVSQFSIEERHKEKFRAKLMQMADDSDDNASLVHVPEEANTYRAGEAWGTTG